MQQYYHHLRRRSKLFSLLMQQLSTDWSFPNRSNIDNEEISSDADFGRRSNAGNQTTNTAWLKMGVDDYV